MKIAAVTMVYNESLILPYYLRHYSYLNEIHILFETDTTDESLEILNQAKNVIIEKCHIEGGIDDLEKIRLMNNAVQNTKADWVYVVDPDEFVFPPNESPKMFLARQTHEVVRSMLFQVYRHRDDKDLDPLLPPIPQRIHGDPNIFSTKEDINRASNAVYIKPNIVRPSNHLEFLPGHHQIKGNPKVSSESYIGAHWQMADPSIAIHRRLERKSRMSERNKLNKMGWQHYDITEKTIQEECERHKEDPIIEALHSYHEESIIKNTLISINNSDDISLKNKDIYGFNPFEHPVCFSLPRRKVPLFSWRQHVPFAMLLVDILKPRTLVELGVHYGDSYCAFCQAVDELGLNTTCYGVDTWKGDPHASFYSSDILQDLRKHHDPLYGSFSHLVQSTFDDALPLFSDGMIDILHIDGYHTYKAVKHDFETWLPKLSDRGVIVLHDVNEKQTDFGAWKVWAELEVRYPHFLFLHCHGLGIVAVGNKPLKELNWLFEANDQTISTIRNFFFNLGDRLTDKMLLDGGTGSVNDSTDSELLELRIARNELQAIRSSITWRVLKKILGFIDKWILPMGSRRRILAARLLRSTIRTLSMAKSTQITQIVTSSEQNNQITYKYIRGTGVIVGEIPSFIDIPSNVQVNYIPSSEFEKMNFNKSAKDITNNISFNNDGITDFVIIAFIAPDIHILVQTVQKCMPILKPGGIIYLVISEDDVSQKTIDNLKSFSENIRIVESTTIISNGKKHKVYIVEKTNYLSKIKDMLVQNPKKTWNDDKPALNVIVSIHNAYEELERCLYSIFQHQDIYHILLINDCSTDNRINTLLNSLKEHQSERFEILENENNLGYLATVNKGMRKTSGDVVLINSDTVVTSGWARKMRECAYARDRIATVTPFSNNGGECSIPEFVTNNEIPVGFTIDTFAKCVEGCSIKQYPELLTAVGFCMLIRREIINEIGYFDEDNFGKGYGEENDFSIRAVRKGYKNILCDNTFVYHKGSASFGNTKLSVIEKSHVVIQNKYPEFWSALRIYTEINPLKELQQNIKKTIKTQNSNISINKKSKS